MKDKESKRRKIFCILLTALIILTIAFIWSNSMKSKADSTGQSNLIVNFLKPLLDPHGKFTHEQFSFFVRKAAHFSEFALLGAEMMFLLRLIRRAFFYAPPTVLAVAIIDETIQHFSERAAMITDVIIDFCGGIFGIMLAFLLMILIDHIKSSHNKTKKA